VEEDDDGMSTATMTDAITLEEATASSGPRPTCSTGWITSRGWRCGPQGGYTIPTEHDVKDYDAVLNVVMTMPPCARRGSSACSRAFP
jgi:hypothetical protein